MKKLLGVWDVAKMNKKELQHFCDGIAKVVNKMATEDEEKQERLESHSLDFDEAIEKD